MKPYLLPFVLFERQEEMVRYLDSCYEEGTWGTIAKCRYTGASYITLGWLLHKLLFTRNFTGTLASNKADMVDKSDSNKCLFYKIIDMHRRLPAWMQMFDLRKHKSRMTIYNPLTNSSILGESGREIGRGGRSSFALIDEAAFIEADRSMVAALSENTDCAVFVSTPNGKNNKFFDLIKSPVVKNFYYYWYADPRRTLEWRKEQDYKLGADIAAQELDVSFDASTEAKWITSEWMEAAIELYSKLHGKGMGTWHAGLDVAIATGGDNTILTLRQGCVVQPQIKIDINDTTTLAHYVDDYLMEQDFAVESLCYDGDGLGSGVTGAFRNMEMFPDYQLIEFRGAGKCSERYWVDREMKSKEFLYNMRSEAFFELRERFRKTFAYMQHWGGCLRIYCRCAAIPPMEQKTQLGRRL